MTDLKCSSLEAIVFVLQILLETQSSLDTIQEERDVRCKSKMSVDMAR